MPRVYDCVMFFNEIDMLKARMNILNNVVDYFVVCEASQTHSGLDKPYYFLENIDTFRPWIERIIYVQAGDLKSAGNNSWMRERYHRDQIGVGLNRAEPTDWVIVSDCDEIPDPMQLSNIKELDREVLNVRFELDFYYYDLLHKVKQGWSIGAVRWRACKDPNKIRNGSSGILAFNTNATIYPAGWHFSYFGGAEQILRKVDSFMHFNDPVIRDLPRDINHIQSKINAGIDLYGRSDFEIKTLTAPDWLHLPIHVQENREEYRKMGWF